MWYFVLLVYSLIGLIIIVATPARRDLVDQLTDKALSAVPRWKAASFRIIIASAALLFWPVFLPGWLRHQKSAWERLEENPAFQRQKALFDAMKALGKDGCDSDEIPNGKGEFGLALTNPIPTNTIFGSNSYLSRLCTADGYHVTNQRRGSMGAEGIKGPIDIYDLFRANGSHAGTIYISPYQRRNSNKAPRGFKLLFGGSG